MTLLRFLSGAEAGALLGDAPIASNHAQRNLITVWATQVVELTARDIDLVAPLGRVQRTEIDPSFGNVTSGRWWR